LTVALKQTEHFSSIRGGILALAGLLLAGNLSVSAAPIKNFREFLVGGPGHWATTQLMEVPSGDHHPVAFDRRHPVLGPMLAEAQELRGTNFVVSPAKSGHSARAESIHAMVGSSKTSSHAASTQAGAGTQPPSVTTAQARTVEPSHDATVVLPHVALQEMVPPAVPTTGGFTPSIHQEISSSSVVSSNCFPGLQQTLEGSPEAIPEPSTVALTLLLFGSAACWNRRRSGG
jgi:hypothetical protein